MTTRPLVSDLLQALHGPTMLPLEEDRRLVSRVLRHILQSGMAGHLPRLNDVDPWLVGDDWSNCALVRIRKARDQSFFIVVGDKLLSGPSIGLDGEPISRCSPTTLLGVVLFFLAEAVEEHAAIMVEGGAGHSDGPILFRALLVPLSEDNQTVEAVLIAANFRERREEEQESAVTRRAWSYPFASGGRESPNHGIGGSRG
jgi:hypothetical protein